MAILKIRDSAGNVQEILTIKGQDYVLTEEDKQEIASLVTTAEAPTKVSQLENDAKYVKQEDLTPANIGAVAVEEFDALKEDIPTKVSQLENDHEYASMGNLTVTENRIYTYIEGVEQNIPTKVSHLENDAGYLTEHQSLEGYAKTTDIPDVSAYQTEDQVNTLIAEALSAASIAYVGSTAPTSDLGKDGDIYIVTE